MKSMEAETAVSNTWQPIAAFWTTSSLFQVASQVRLAPAAILKETAVRRRNCHLRGSCAVDIIGTLIGSSSRHAFTEKAR